MAKTETQTIFVSVENRSGGPLRLDTPAGATIPEEFQNLYLGDPLDRGRKTDDGTPLPTPEVTMPLEVWDAYENAYPAFIQGMIESGDLIVRA
jgi:hypothetical protein